MNYLERIVRNLPGDLSAECGGGPFSFCMVRRRDASAIFIFPPGRAWPHLLVKVDSAGSPSGTGGAAGREMEAFAFLKKEGFGLNGYGGDPLYLDSLPRPALVFPLGRLEPYTAGPFSADGFAGGLEEMAGTERRLISLPAGGLPGTGDPRFENFLMSPKAGDNGMRREIGDLIEWRSGMLRSKRFISVQQGDCRLETLFRCGGAVARLHWEGMRTDLFLSDWASFACTRAITDFSGRKAKKRFRSIARRLLKTPRVRDIFFGATERLLQESGIPPGESRNFLRLSLLRYLFHEAPRYPEIITEAAYLWRVQ